jgi:hypothetical protein
MLAFNNLPISRLNIPSDKGDSEEQDASFEYGKIMRQAASKLNPIICDKYNHL